MDRVGWLLVALALGAVVFLGAWLATQTHTPVSPEDKGALTFPLVPKPTATVYPSSGAVIESIQHLSRLETAVYTIDRVITAESGQGPLGFLFGDKLLLIARGQVTAGIDLAHIGPADVLLTGDGTVYLKLPPAEVFAATLDNEGTSVYDRQTGAIGLNPELETAARREAERLILEAAQEGGVMDEAATNAEDVLRSFLLALGFERVLFVDVLPTPTPIPTATPALTGTAMP